MKIEVNGELKEFNNQTYLKTIVDAFVTNTKGMAVAVNNTVVPKIQWAETLLQENDKVLLIKATQGG